MAEEIEMTPVGADEIPPKATPFGKDSVLAAPAAPAPAAPAPAPAVPSPAPAAAPAASGGTTIRLKPVIRKPVIRKPGEMATPVPPPDAAKKQTHSLKSVTGPIPAQATLRKTGIIAEGILTPAQQQAAKSKTSRISLESAIGVAPAVSQTPAPLKTIRLRRPTDLNKPPAPSPFASPKPLAPATDELPKVDTEASTVVAAPAENAEADSTVTQKKTLKLRRPGMSLSPKRPTLGGGDMNGPSGADAAADGVGDLPELQPLDVADLGGGDVPSSTSAGVPGWLLAITTITSIAAMLVLGAVFYFLFMEGCAPVAGDNYTAFIAL